jgi:hypothetical protein
MSNSSESEKNNLSDESASDNENKLGGSHHTFTSLLKNTFDDIDL